MNQKVLETLSKPELLSPAGDPVSLRAALDAGADAVYFGAGGLNMRMRARNFRTEDLPSIVSTCREYNARAYLTLNTIVYENECRALDSSIDAAADAGVDAVICWDHAVIQSAARRGLAVHLSTQASVSNSRSIIRFFRNDGIRRFVLARECSLDHIRSIRSSLRAELGDEAEKIELEVFIHGAMCVSVSGRCFMSESITGDSGNRGECLQPCRREYRIIDVEGEYEFDIGRDYVMSPKDLCTMPFLEQILTSGVHSLKVEGRMRSPEYVSAVTGAYRAAIDFFFDSPERVPGGFDELKVRLTNDMRSVFNRDFSPGYYMGRPSAAWAKTANSQAERRKETVGVVVNYYRKAGAAEIRVQGASFRPGDELLIQGPTTGNLSVQVESIQVEHKTVESAMQGMHVAVPVSRQVRPNDAVFRRFPAGEANL